MNITGFLAIGNNEKCPWCELIVQENTDVLKHMIHKHPGQMNKMLSEEENK